MNGRCRHDRAIWIPLGEPSDWSKRAMECQDCHEWLPLGHSDETPERVALEIRAAELSIGRDTLNICEHCEVCGWLAHKDDLHHEPQAHHVDDEFHAGYLARVIATHKETP